MYFSRTIAYNIDNGQINYLRYFTNQYGLPITLGQIKEVLVRDSKGAITESNVNDFKYLFYDNMLITYEKWFLIKDDNEMVPQVCNDIRICLILAKTSAPSSPSRYICGESEPDSQIDLEFVDVKKRVRLDLYENDAISLEQLRKAFNDKNIKGISFTDIDKKKTELVPNYKQMILLAKDGIKFIKKYSLCLESPQIKKTSGILSKFKKSKNYYYSSFD